MPKNSEFHKTKRRVLLVDDDELLLLSLKEFIEDCTEQFYLAKDGLDALQIINTRSVDVVITDYRMPKMNCLQLLLHLRRNFPRIETYFHTGNIMARDVRIAVQAGLVEVFEKGECVDELRARCFARPTITDAV